MRKKFVWLTDTHICPWQHRKFLRIIRDADPAGVFITGDITNGKTTAKALDYLAENLDVNIYFVQGNHDHHFSSFKQADDQVRQVCLAHKNLIWLDQSTPMPLNEEAGIIGCMGWYDGRNGDRDYIRCTFDWFLIDELRALSWDQRFEAFKTIADTQTERVVEKLESALDDYKSVILLTHFPPYKEANRFGNLFDESFWSAYNTNVGLGKALEKVMDKHKKRHLTVLCGHTHCPTSIEVSRNITCRVGRGSYSHLTDEEIIYI
jgi:Icc-related predicted phosphoesterase